MSHDFTNWDSASQIDPLIRKLFQKNNQEHEKNKTEHPVDKTRKLGALYAMTIGISAMVLVILLGIVRCTDVDNILVGAARTLPLFCVLGFIAGKIAEMCIRDAVKSLLRRMLKRVDALSGDHGVEEPPNRN